MRLCRVVLILKLTGNLNFKRDISQRHNNNKVKHEGYAINKLSLFLVRSDIPFACGRGTKGLENKVLKCPHKQQLKVLIIDVFAFFSSSVFVLFLLTLGAGC